MKTFRIEINLTLVDMSDRGQAKAVADRAYEAADLVKKHLAGDFSYLACSEPFVIVLEGESTQSATPSA